MFQISTLVFVLIIGSAVCQNTNDLDVDELEKKINEIPGLESFNKTNLPNEEDLEKLVREKCEKNGASEEAFNALKNQKTEVQSCVEKHLNFTQIQEEVELAKKTGSMDEVFGKYCKKYPEINGCVTGVTNRLRPCLDQKEQDSLDKVLKLIDELREFICFKDGDRLAMFIAEGGVECLESMKEELQECANKTLGARIPSDLSVNSLPVFLFGERECRDFDDVRKCVNVELEKCKDTTPANIVDAFFKFLKKHMPCETIAVKAVETSPNSAPSTAAALFILVAPLLLSKLL